MSQLFGRMLAIAFICLSMVACEKEELLNETPINDVALSYEAIELEVLDLVNNYRNEIGLPTLSLLNLVSKEAESHSIYMVKQGLLSHDNFDVRTKNLIDKTDAISIAENVGFGYNTAETLFESWLNSPSHSKNFEAKRYTHIGISAKKNSNGIYYVTQIFIERY